MSVCDTARLRHLLGGPEWQWLRSRLRRTLEGGSGLPASVTLVSPTAAERQAANRLLATPGAVGPVRLRLAELARLLGEASITSSTDLEEVRPCLEELDGPLVNRRAEAELTRQQWDDLHARARTPLAPLASAPEALARLESLGLWRRLAANDARQAENWVGELLLLGEALRAGKEWLLAELAAVTTGDAHALDRGRALGTLALRLFGAAEVGEGVLAWRDAWRMRGVRADELSAPVLCLNVWHRDGRPRRMMPRALLSPCVGDEPRSEALAVVFVCENPTVVAAAADRLGQASAALVCVDGQPSTAALLLLERLSRHGGRLHYHGDADWPGIAIGDTVYQQFGFTPWCFDAPALAAQAHLPGPPLMGDPVPALWDPGFAPALALRGRALHEEAMLGELLVELGGEGASTGRATL